MKVSNKHRATWFGFVLFAAFLLLMATFRSLVIPIKAIVLNLLSVGAAYGVLVIVFQYGWGEGLLFRFAWPAEFRRAGGEGCADG